MQSQTGTNRILTRNQKACTSCRQVKLRCDSKENFPAPCTRCRKHNLTCRVDPTFKRTRTRHRLDEVTSQLNAIQKTLELQQSGSSSGNRLQRDEGPESGAAASVSTADATPGDLELGFFDVKEGDILADFQLGDVTLDVATVVDQFKFFEENYYPHCPILSTEKSLNELYAYFPFLFWTILTISGRFKTELADVYPRLVPQYRTLLGSILAGPILNIEIIQGIILLCFWPLPVPRQQEDPTWNYCGLVTNALQRMGLHRFKGDEESSGETMMKLKTWMACVQLNSFHISSSGLSLPAEITNTAMTNISSMRGAFSIRSKVQLQLTKSALMLNEIHNLESPSFIQLLMQEMIRLKDSESDEWPVEAELMHTGARLCICALGIQKINSSHITTTNFLIQQGFEAAVTFINTFSELHQAQSTSPNPPLPSTQHLPKYFFVLLMFATSFIFKSITTATGLTNSSSSSSSNISNSPMDDAIALNHIRLAYNINTSLSHDPMDEHGRASRLIRVLSTAYNRSRLRLDETRPDAHAGITLLEDVIRTGKEIRESSTADQQTTTITTAATPLDENQPHPTLTRPTLPDQTALLADPNTLDLDLNLDFETMNFESDLGWGFDFSSTEFLNLSHDPSHRTGN